jgi:hypothetical protein
MSSERNLELPYFRDVSRSALELEADIHSMELVRLRNGLNKHPYTSVKCPWGCDEFLERSKFIPMFALMEQELEKKSLPFNCPSWEKVSI